MVTGDGGGVVITGSPTITGDFNTLPTATTQFVPIQAAGGDFTKFATVSGGSLVVAVPAGNNGGRTGIRSNYDLLDMRSDFATSPATVDFVIHPARTSGFEVALSTVAYDDIWASSDAWMS